MWHFSFCEPLSLSLYPSIFLYVENTRWFQQPLGDISDPCDAHCPLGYEVWRGAWYPFGRVEDVLGSWKSSGIPWPHFIALPHSPPPTPTPKISPKISGLSRGPDCFTHYTLHTGHITRHTSQRYLSGAPKSPKEKVWEAWNQRVTMISLFFTLSLGIYDYTGKIILLSSDTKRQSIQTLMCLPENP